MSSRRSFLLRLAARLLGIALVAYVLVTQVRWSDEVTLVDGTRLSGSVSRGADDTWRLVPEHGEPRILAASEIRREHGDLAISLGLPTLAGRLRGSLGTVALVLLALIALALVTAWRWRWLVQALGLSLSAGEAIRYTLYGVFFNLFVPGSTGGDVVKAWYAAHRTGHATKAVVSVLVDRLVGLFALVLFAASILFLGEDRPGFQKPRLLVGLVLLASVVAGTLVLSRRVRRGLGLSALLRRLPFQRVWSEVDAAVRLYRGHPGSLLLGLLVSFANHAGTSACVYFLAQALGLTRIGLADTMALVPVVSLLSAIPLLPGGWGVGELAFAAFFAPLGVGASEAVALSVVFRLAVLASGLPGAVLWLVSREHPRRREMADEMARAADAVAEDAAVQSPPPGVSS